jgi:hypothetical protein
LELEREGEREGGRERGREGVSRKEDGRERVFFLGGFSSFAAKCNLAGIIAAFGGLGGTVSFPFNAGGFLHRFSLSTRDKCGGRRSRASMWQMQEGKKKKKGRRLIPHAILDFLWPFSPCVPEGMLDAHGPPTSL